MKIILHPHAAQRAIERGANFNEVQRTIQEGETFPAKYGRTGFRLNMPYEDIWIGNFYHTKQVEAYAVSENDTWIVITLIVKYF